MAYAMKHVKIYNGGKTEGVDLSTCTARKD